MSLWAGFSDFSQKLLRCHCCCETMAFLLLSLHSCLLLLCRDAGCAGEFPMLKGTGGDLQPTALKERNPGSFPWTSWDFQNIVRDTKPESPKKPAHRDLTHRSVEMIDECCFRMVNLEIIHLILTANEYIWRQNWPWFGHLGDLCNKWY